MPCESIIPVLGAGKQYSELWICSPSPIAYSVLVRCYQNVELRSVLCQLGTRSRAVMSWLAISPSPSVAFHSPFLFLSVSHLLILPSPLDAPMYPASLVSVSSLLEGTTLTKLVHSLVLSAHAWPIHWLIHWSIIPEMLKWEGHHCWAEAQSVMEHSD